MSLESKSLRLRLSPKETQESFASPEKLLPTPECLVILGGGIDQVTIKNRETHGERKVWKPSGYVAEKDSAIESEDKRTGIRRPLTKEERPGEELVVHGGTAHLLAGIQFLDEMRGRGAMPKRVVFAAGRPDYIQNVTDDKDADEGKVMLQEFERRTEMRPFEGTAIEVRGEGSKNTAGDLLNGLKATTNNGLGSAVVIVTEARMERTRAMCEVLQKNFPKLAQIEVTFISAEDLLRRRYFKDSLNSRTFKKIQEKLKGSALWKETKKREDEGIMDLKKGTYDLRISGIDTDGLL